MGNTQVKVKTIYYQKEPFAQVISQARPGPYYQFDRENTIPTMYVYKSSRTGEPTKIFLPTMSFHDAVLFIKSTLYGLEMGKEIGKESRKSRHRHRHRHRRHRKS